MNSSIIASLTIDTLIMMHAHYHARTVPLHYHARTAVHCPTVHGHPSHHQGAVDSKDEDVLEQYIQEAQRHNEVCNFHVFHPRL